MSFISYITGLVKLKGATDGTKIGNVGDSLKTNVTASALPSGAATEAKQDTGNTSLSAIDAQMTDGTQQTKIKGNTDGTLTGNIGDSLKVHQTNDITVNIGNNNTDLFDRVAMAEDSPLWSHTHRYDSDQDLYWDKYTSSGTGTFSVDEDIVSAVLTNSTGSGDILDYRTFRYFEYSKGRTQSFLFTMNPKGATANVTKRFGAFDDENGLFWELDNGTAKVVVRSSVSGTTVDTEYLQTNWTDPFDGTGASGFTIDWTKFNLFYIQYAWLGGNAVEFGIFKGGVRYPMHRISYGNIDDTSYSQSGNLPLCFNIVNNAVLGSAPTMEVNCLSVFNNGRQDQLGEVFSVDTGAVEVTVGTVETVLAAIRMGPTQNKGSIRPVNFDLLSPSGNSTIYYKVEVGGTFTGDIWNPITYSIAEALDSYTTYTNGFTLQSGYIQAGGANITVTDILSNLYLGRLTDGTSQTLVITVRTVASNAKILFSGRYREYK